ncbi:hypothetical protein CQA53_08965 [Helicobacter didelphidarum]|uniref:Phage tail tape measure protein n=1 Tax=Helicobacter didelphidarum TaxID=2040648 RepID=A0A3D8ICI6_9HELI|nr:hypothetical protein [Helicobacter didelphidarum]RDU62828.1 hypothetical protein CQA53_08965 [Helicobacter didelphidarum]
MQILKELAIKFTAITKPLQQALNNVGRDLESVNSKIAKVAGGLGLAYGAQALLSNLVKAGSELQRFSDLTGISASETQTLGEVLEKFGGNTQSAQTNLQAMQKAMYEASQGGDALINFQKKFGKGIDLQGGQITDIRKAILQFAESFKGLSKQQAIAKARAEGFTDDFVLALQEGGSALADMLDNQAKLNLTTAEDAKTMRNFSNVIADLRQILMKVAMMIAKVVLPPLQFMAKAFTKFFTFIQGNKRIVLSVLMAIVGVLVVVKKGLLAIAIANMKAWLPFYALGALILGVAVIIEDIWGYLNGAESITGKLVKKYEWLDTTIKAIAKVFSVVWDIVKGIWAIISPIVFDIIIIAVKQIASIFTGIFDIVQSIFNFFRNPNMDSFLNIINTIGDSIKNTLMIPVNTLMGYIDNIKSKLVNLLPSWAQKLLGSEANSSDVITNSNSNFTTTINNNNPQVRANITQNISSATPQELAQGTSDLMVGQLRTAVVNGSSGGY